MSFRHGHSAWDWEVGGKRGQLLLHTLTYSYPHLFQVRLMITDAARHKLLVLTGQCFENTGELILQSGSFSFQNFIEIFTDQEVGSVPRVWATVWMLWKGSSYSFEISKIDPKLLRPGLDHCYDQYRIRTSGICAGVDISGQCERIWNDHHLRMAEVLGTLEPTKLQEKLSFPIFSRDFFTDLLDFSRMCLP